MKRAFLLPRTLAIPPCGFDKLTEALQPYVEAHSWETELSSFPEIPMGYEIGSEIARLRTEAKSAAIERVTLFGEGDGAGIAVAFAMRFPEMIDTLVLFDPVLVGPPALTQLESQTRSDLMAVLNHAPSELLEVYVRQSVRAEIADDIVVHATKALPTLPANAIARYKASILALARFSVDYSALEGVSGSAFIGVGEDASRLLKEHSRLLSRLLPAGRLRVYPGAHPFNPAYCNRPDLVARDILECWGEDVR